MRLLAVVALVIVALTVVWAVRVYNVHRAKKAPWRVTEKTKGKGVYLYLTKLGEQPIEVARVDIGDDDYENTYTEAVFAAESKAASMNANRRLLGNG